jgi:hypothetical protein
MRLRLALAAVAAACCVAPAATAGQQSIAACLGGTATCGVSSVTTTSGVYFKVTTGGGNRDYASVAVTCSSGATVVYSTVLNVVVEPKSSGTSQTIYPPASSCRADLEKQMFIGKAQILATTTFTVT